MSKHAPPTEAGTQATQATETGARAGPPAAAWALLPPRYQDLGIIGVGGMGQVHRVRDRVLGRVLAMKVMLAPLATRAVTRARFQREARITAGLQHPGIVAVYDEGELADGRLWYTMPELRGQTLEAALPDLPFWRRMEALVRVAQAMAYAHGEGVVHRDLKPSNVMVGGFGEVLVLDWGLARRINDVDLPAETLDLPEVSAGLTRVGAVLGTPAYMPPEQAAGLAVGPPADVFALGAMLREVLAAEANPSVELVEISQRALAPEATDRFPQAAPLAEALLAWQAGARRRAEARVVLDQALALRAPLAAARAEAETLARQAEAILAPLPAHAPVEQKKPGWRLEKAAQAQTRAVRLLEIELVQKARAALERADDLVEAHDLLADLYQQRAAEAEARRDLDTAAEYLALLRSHDRGSHAAWLTGQGRLTLHTDPAGATLTLYRLEAEDRRLVPGEPVVLGTSPVVDLPLDPGSYEVHIETAGRPKVVVPVAIERGEAWTAGPPEAPHRPVALPAQLGADEVYVPAGWCWTGGDPRAPDSLPRRRLWIDSFVMLRHPITHGQYLEFLNDLIEKGCETDALQHALQAPMGYTDQPTLVDSRGPDGRFESTAPADHPVVNVTWHGARAYARWLADRTGQAWQLPHELAWEKAARGADGRFFPWGDDFEATWTRALHSTPGPPQRVAIHAFAKDESPLGVRGLAGNVRDWCANLFLRAPPEDGTVVSFSADPEVQPTDFVAARGGSMASLPHFCRSAARFGARPSERYLAVGFRLVRPLGDTRPTA